VVPTLARATSVVPASIMDSRKELTMITRRITGTVLATAAIGLVAATIILPEAWSQSARPRQQATPATSLDGCREVIGDLRVLGSDITTLDLALDEKLSWMKSAPDEQRFEALGTVLEELIVQRCQMRELMKATHQKLFAHLFEHLMVDDAEARRASIMGCPVMRQMVQEQRVGDPVPVPEQLVR
jgi:hypothetical protein